MEKATTQVVIVDPDIVQMSLSRARQLDTLIIDKTEGIQAHLVEIYTELGWATLGFHSWDAYLQDLGERTPWGSKYLRRMNNAALLEAGSGYDLGTFKEGTLRPINDTLSDAKGFCNKDREEALELALELAGKTEAITGVVAQAAAWYIVVSKRTPANGHRLVERMKEGAVSPKIANELCQIIRASKAIGVEHILAEVSSTRLAETLLNLHSTNGEQWPGLKETIERSGMMPTGTDGQVPISEATNNHLISYLNAPLKMQRYEKVVERLELLHNISEAAASLMIKYYGVVTDELPEALALSKNAGSHVLEPECALYELLQKAGMIRHGRKG